MTAEQDAYARWRDQGLALDLTRGKPSPDQLDLSNDLVRVDGADWFRVDDGDARNYGGAAAGLRSLREIFAPDLQVPVDQLCAADNSSLSLMYTAVATSFFDSPAAGAPPWRAEPRPKFLCPVPGYDRHFTVTHTLGAEMVPVPMTATGPDMDVVEKLVANDPDVRGMWLVPKYSNPTGYTCDAATVQRLAAMPVAAPDFRIYWDNAYAVHHLTDTPDELPDVLAACERAGNPDRVFVFGSTSKITFAGAGVSFFGSSPANVEWWLRHARTRTIEPDRIRQVQHARFLKDTEGLHAHMRAHRALLRPRFDVVEQALAAAFTGADDVRWTTPNGGYFVSVDLPRGTAGRVVALAAEVGVKLTPAGATFPLGDDPQDANLRIAPSFPSIDELETAMQVLVDCVRVARG